MKNFLKFCIADGIQAAVSFGLKPLALSKEISKSKGWNMMRWITRDDNLRVKSLYDRVAEKTN